MSELFKCSKCNFYESINELSVKKHSKRCDGNFQGYQCSLCLKRLMSKPLLQQHNTSSHSKREKRECSYCLRKLELKEIDHYRHENNCWNNPKNSITYNCYYCKRKYVDEVSRNKHSSECYFKPVENIDNITFNIINENNTKNVGIYKIVSPAGSVYIGMTNDSFENRWNAHFKKLKSNNHHCAGLQRAYNKYGWEALQKIILEEYPKQITNDENIILNNLLLLREIQIWEEYKENNINIYNGRPTGTGSVKHTEESKEKTRFTYYFKNQSSCKIYITSCSECNELFTSRKNRKTCGDECLKNFKLKNTKNSRRNRKEQKNKETSIDFSKYTHCKYNKCYNYIATWRTYCGTLCQMRDKQGEDIGLRIPKPTLEEYYLDKLYSTTEIAKAFNTNHVNVQKLLKDNGIPLRNRTEGLHAKQVRWVRENIQKDTFISNFNKYSLKDLSKIYGTKLSNINRAVGEYIT